MAALEAEQEAVAEAKAAPVAVVSEAFPVGSVFFAAVSTDPAQLLGYGTWQELKDVVAGVHTWERKS